MTFVYDVTSTASRELSQRSECKKLDMDATLK